MQHSSQGTSSTPTSASNMSRPWSSGRVLTEEQRRRKREANRISQKRRKEQLAHRVESLEAKCRNLVGTIPSPRLEHPSCEQRRADANKEGLNRTDSECYDIPANLSSITPLDPNSSSAYKSCIAFQPSHLRYYQAFLSSGSYIVPPAILPVATALSRTSNSSSAVSDFCDNLNTAVLLMTEFSRISTDDVENQNMLIQAVFEGWQVIGNSGKHCPLWTILQCVDLSISNSGMDQRLERLVLLRTVHIMLLFRLEKLSRESLPTWFRPRPAQLKYNHHPVIDYLVWPGLRERLILDENLKTTDRFWTLYAKCIRFNWPYSLTACYKKDAVTGMLSFTDLFKKQTSDVNNIQMTSEFFQAFPEIADDIPLAPEHSVLDVDQCLLTDWDPYSVSGQNIHPNEGNMFETNNITGIFGALEATGLVGFENTDIDTFWDRKI